MHRLPPLLLLAASAIAQDPAPVPGPALAPAAPSSVAARAPLSIRFSGLLPGNVNPTLEGRFKVEFRIYPSPQGGQPNWRETQDVTVAKGRMEVCLGSRTPIPMAIHESTYKWLGASVNGQREIFPRYPIVNVVYASPREALLAHERWQAEQQSGKTAAGYVPKVTGAVPTGGSHEPLTWKEALEAAQGEKKSLPDYEEWYRRLEALPPDESADWTGHYEWVLPWVYDTASHGRYNELFRGRFQGCDYSDLSPQKKYRFRLAAPVSSQPTTAPEGDQPKSNEEKRSP